MTNSINLDKNELTNQERDLAVQTALTGSTVYALPKRTTKRNTADRMLRIMDEDGPQPMINMRPAKKARTAADQFYDDHHREYDAHGQTHYNQIERVHAHNNAYPKMYDELDKRRSTQQVGITGLAGQMTIGGKPQDPASQNSKTKFDPTCPKCIKRKKRIEAEGKRRKRICKKCQNQRRKKEPRNKLGRVTKHREREISKPYKPYIICSNKCFQCHLPAEMKSVSTFKSCNNFVSVPQEHTLAQGISLKENQEKIDKKPKSSHKKKVGKKQGSIDSDVNYGQPDTESRPSVSSYHSFLSEEHEPMVE